MAKKKEALESEKVKDLLFQALQTELGGVLVYKQAIQCAVHNELRDEWEKYLLQTEKHVVRLTEAILAMGLNPGTQTAGRRVVKFIGESLVQAMQLALAGGDPEAAQVVACECVVHAETKDHANWELIGMLLKKGNLENSDALRAAYEEIEDEEDEHLYHTKGWCRELALRGLGLPAVLPPPEEQQDVKTAIAAARAQKMREEMNPQPA